MKITFIMANATYAGGTRVIATQARELMARGHEVVAVTTPPPPPSWRYRVWSLLHGKGWPKTPKAGGSFLDDTGVPHQVIERFRPITDRDVPDADVVIATWWQTGEWVWNLSPSKGAKAFFIQHYETWGGDPARVNAVWKLPMHKIVISRWLADLARDKFQDSDISRVPNSVDMKLFNATERGKQSRPTIGVLYNHVPFKGFDVSSKAIEIIRKSLPDLQVISFGEAEPHANLPLPPNTRYTVRPPQEKIRELYAQCDLWLCGSRAEGFHLPPLEAMACRCPVVSTRVGGPMDIIVDGENGYLVDVEDHAALAERALQVLRLSDQGWRKMSDAAYATACRYSWQDAAALLEQALRHAVEKQKSGAAKERPEAKSRELIP